MQKVKFELYLKQLTALTVRQRQRLLGLLLPKIKCDETVEVIEEHTGGQLVCLGCGGRDFHKHGRAHGLQRYRCRNCGRTRNGLSGTPLARLRYKERWLDYLGGMLDSHSIRRAAVQLGVASATSFRWRHRFLALSKHDRPGLLSGIAEADEMYVLESQKGSRTLDRAPRKRGGKATKRGISLPSAPRDKPTSPLNENSAFFLPFTATRQIADSKCKNAGPLQTVHPP